MTDEAAKQKSESMRPLDGSGQKMREHLSLKSELTLALPPTLTVPAIFALVEIFNCRGV